MIEDLLFEEMLERSLWFDLNIVFNGNSLNALFVIAVELSDIFLVDFNKFSIFHLNVVRGVLFEGDLFRSNEDRVVRKADENRRAVTSDYHFVWVLFVDNDETPLSKGNGKQRIRLIICCGLNAVRVLKMNVGLMHLVDSYVYDCFF